MSDDFIYVHADTWLGPAYLRRDREGNHDRPRKKFRNAKRYYLRLQKRVEDFQLQETWYDFWHSHLDLKGEGDRSWADRRRHLEAQIALLRRVERLTHSWVLPHQAWLQIYPADSWEDCIWLHTPNPHSKYPCGFDQVDWQASPPPQLLPLLDLRVVEFGRVDQQRTIFFLRTRVAAPQPDG